MAKTWSRLKHGLDRLPPVEAAAPPGRVAPVHEHVRGREYYQDGAADLRLVTLDGRPA